MTSGDEAGALTEPKARTDSGADAHDDPAPAEPEPGDEDLAEPADASSADADSVEADSGADLEEDEEDQDEEDEDTASPVSAGGWVASMALLVVLLIAGLVTVGIYWSRANSAANAAGGSPNAAIAVARTAVTDLTTVSYKNADAYAAKLKPLAAGNFLSQYGNSASGFKNLLEKGKVQSSGQVVQVGVDKYNGKTAQLAVLAYVTVKNTQTPKGSERAYRLAVSMVQSGSKWLVSNVQFVQ
ncbi:MAG: hypothetical protein J2P25_14020 [Nocardiopsaceae bacterium]|nr:hypothetical protein [Nocardiopsaceae bacterium]